MIRAFAPVTGVAVWVPGADVAGVWATAAAATAPVVAVQSAPAISGRAGMRNRTGRPPGRGVETERLRGQRDDGFPSRARRKAPARNGRRAGWEPRAYAPVAAVTAPRHWFPPPGSASCAAVRRSN